MLLRRKNKSTRHPEMTDEELVKTQVLNLNDVKEVAKYEKRTNKKPACILAVIGILCILFGNAYPLFIEMITPIEVPKVEKKEVASNLTQTKVSTLTCTKYMPNNLNSGVDELLTHTMSFEDELLKSYSIVQTINQAPNNKLGLNKIEEYKKTNATLISNSTPGYTVTTGTTATGIQLLVNVDLKTLDKNKLPLQNKNNQTVNPILNLNETLNNVKSTYKEWECK